MINGTDSFNNCFRSIGYFSLAYRSLADGGTLSPAIQMINLVRPSGRSDCLIRDVHRSLILTGNGSPEPKPELRSRPSTLWILMGSDAPLTLGDITPVLTPSPLI